MKWPTSLWLIRHGESEYNILKAKMQEDPDYLEFLKKYDSNPTDPDLKPFVTKLMERHCLGYADWDTPLTPEGVKQAIQTGKEMKARKLTLPDVIFFSPYRRTIETLDYLCEGYPELKQVTRVREDRIREQDHGLVTVYNNYRFFNVFYPDQKTYRDQTGEYYYRHMQGENVPDVIDRLRSFITTLVRDYSNQKVGIVTHHLSILSFLAVMKRWDQVEFTRWDQEQKPVNCGLTFFEGNPKAGADGRLELKEYNQKWY